MRHTGLILTLVLVVGVVLSACASPTPAPAPAPVGGCVWRTAGRLPKESQMDADQRR